MNGQTRPPRSSTRLVELASTRLRFTLKKNEILRGRKTTQEIFARGQRIRAAYIHGILLIEPRETTDTSPNALVGFFARSTVKRAVDRNKMKRWMRESYRLNKHSLLNAMENLPSSLKLLFLYAPKKISHASKLPSYKEVEQDVQHILATITAMKLQ